MYKKILSKLFSGIVCLTLVIPMISGVGTPVVAEAAGPLHHATGWAFSDMPDQSEQSTGIGCIRESGPALHWNCSQGLGWISMSGTNANSGGGSYEVTVDPVTGKFGGYAWSEWGGWVDFAPSATPPQSARTASQSAFVDPACLADKTKTCDIKGWIRFVTGASGTTQWDGWVSMGSHNPVNQNDLTDYRVKLLPEVNGVRKFSGYGYGDWVAGWLDFGQAQLQLTDVCPDTKFVKTSDPKNTGVDPKTAGVQTTMPAGYSVKDGLCGIFGCTDKTASNYNKNATIDDGSCIAPPRPLCPDGVTPVPPKPGECPEVELCPDGSLPPKGDLSLCPGETLCPDGSVRPPSGICPSDPEDPEDQCKNIKDVQTTVPSPYTQVIQAGVKNCYIIGCMDPHANNQTPGATMQDNPSSCTYDPGVEICGNKIDDDRDGQVDENCPSYPTAPKKPIYIET